MKLSKEQIQQLYLFTQQHYVEYFDVQTELVDHLANDIEKFWSNQPAISFEEARDISFKKFGVFGFMEVVEARTNALYKKYWKLVWSNLISYFKIPQIALTGLLFIIIFSSFVIIPNHSWIYMFIGFGICAVLIVRLFQLYKIKKLRFKATNKKWLLEEYILNIGNIGTFAYVLFMFPTRLITQLETTFSMVLISLIFTIYILATYIITFVLPKKAVEILENQYPEYKLL